MPDFPVARSPKACGRREFGNVSTVFEFEAIAGLTKNLGF